MKAPCYGCPDRHVGCHAKCPAYQAFRADKDQENSRRLLEQKAIPQSAMADAINKRRTKASKLGRKL